MIQTKMKGKALAILMSLTMVFTMMPMMTETVHAATYTDSQGIKYEYNVAASIAKVASRQDTYISGDVTIPAVITVNETSYQVSDVEGDAFAGCISLLKINIPATVESIGANAFGNCTSLTSITFQQDSQLTYIGDDAFNGCSNLTSVTFPDGVTSIGRNTFRSCDSLADVYVKYDQALGENPFIYTAQNINVWRYRVNTTASESFDGKTHVTIVSVENKDASDIDVAKSLACGAMGDGYVIHAVQRCATGNEANGWTVYGQHDWKAASCLEPATCKNCGATEGTSTGHSWYASAQSINWTADEGKKPGDPDYYTKENVTITWNCVANDASLEKPAASINMQNKIDATCTEDGSCTYKARFDPPGEGSGDPIAENKNVTIPAIGHKYGVWTKLDANQHQKVCEHNKSHVVKEGHKWDTGKVTKKATEKATGVKTYTCTVCKVTKTETIPKLKPSTPKVSSTPIANMTAKDSNGLAIGWNKIQGAAGYDIFFAECNHNGKKIVCKNVKTIKGNKTFSWTKTGLKKSTAYKAYVKVFVYKNGKKSYVRTTPMMHAYTGGQTKNYTNAKSVTVNKTSVSLKKGKTFKIKASVNKVNKNKKLMPKSHAATLRYMTSNSKIATVNSGGKITAKGKGTCYIYAYAHNGVSKQIKVTVK